MIPTTMIRTIAWLTLAVGIPLTAQTQVDLRTQSKGVDFTGAQSTKPFKSGGALPATCAQGEMFFLTSAGAGTNMYGCTASNTWTLETGGSGGTVQIQNTGTVVGARPILDLSNGQGVLLAISDTGQSIAIQTSLDTSFAETSSNEQSGAPLLCAPASASATAYTCAMSPTLTSYTTGMILHWKPDVSGAGGATTLNVDALGAVPVKTADGTTNPGPADVVAGRVVEIWYDGAVFRLLAQSSSNEQSGAPLLCAPASASGTAYTCAMSPKLTSYTTGMILHWKPDVSGAGGATTLNVDTLGAVPVKTADGSTNPGPGDVVAGRVLEIWYDGAAFRLLAQSSSNEQSGVPLLCAPASGSGTAYTCAMSPTLTSYTTGMILHWKPDVSGTGGATTLNVDTLGPVAVKLADGATNPGPGDVVAGRVLEIWYDGATFRLLASPIPSGILGDAQPTCAAAVRGRLWFVAGATGVKDGLSVCAKDATNAYAWRTIY